MGFIVHGHILKLCKIQILGDSKAVVEWVNGHNQMQVLRLKTLMAQIHRSFFASLEWFSINHIPRELNSLADELSKEALLLDMGAFISQEYFEGQFYEEMNFHL
jgi:ribonuclease HI